MGIAPTRAARIRHYRQARESCQRAMIPSHYRRFADAQDYGRALRAWESARDRALWDALEYLGLVRLEIRADDFATLRDLEGDTFNPSAHPDIPPSRILRERDAERERIEREGVWGIVAQYRTDADAEWEDAHSVWGFVGDDWQSSGYDDDARAQAIDALRNALKSRCRTCRRPRAA